MTTLEDPDAPFRLSTPIEHITKLDDGTLIAHVVATSETPDGQGDPSGRGRWAGDIIDYDAMKAAAPGLMKWAILGEMHDPDRVDAGTILKLHFDDAARRVEADIHVVDPIAIRKVLARVYKMVSIGGIIQRYQLQEIAGRMYRRVTKMLVDELSLVPKGANPDAMISKQFILAKRDATMNADAGIASPLDLPAEEVASLATPPAEEGRTAAQVTIDEVRAALEIGRAHV